MSVPIGFKRLTIRVKDGSSPTLGTNEFVIEGKKDNGGMVSAKVSGLAVEAVKSYSSNKVYAISGKGVGDGKVDFDIMDFPEKVKNAVLGITASSNGVYKATADRTSPYCSILLEDVTPQGNPYLMAFVDGMFSSDGVEFNTVQGKQTELQSEAISFAIGSDDNGLYYSTFVGTGTSTDAAGIAEIKADALMTAPASGGGQ
ncbi:phage tail protein [Lactococcus hircilactis]|uniref:Phage tail protein n=1 Tax=Lactococcus hircilactis TaxID=1494462 RepID=A0A7X1Z9W2_9LACT|nr:major tail protein [Lactococcus hircilactis]MQW40550.1 phage tail protein [Lactococcus hircilactis]